MDRIARLLTELLAPAVVAGAMPLVIAALATRSVSGTLLWGGVAFLFLAALPYLVVWTGVRRGRWTDHHVGVREQRRTPVLAGFVSVLLGVTLLAVLGAPRPLVALAVVLLGVVLVVGALNVWRWKASAHGAVAGASATVLVLVLGGWALPATLAAGAVAWSRVRLGDHTPAQATVGTVLGFSLALALFPSLA